ncbi:MAG: hypothetical protein JRH11_26925 [Deltaproteobacteria bacterium]|nr:hypothetical protein [Deltaproteobacteria bacterium]
MDGHPPDAADTAPAPDSDSGFARDPEAVSAPSQRRGVGLAVGGVAVLLLMTLAVVLFALL